MTREKRDLLKKTLHRMSDYERRVEFMEMAVKNSIWDWFNMYFDHNITVDYESGKIVGVIYENKMYRLS